MKKLFKIFLLLTLCTVLAALCFACEGESKTVTKKGLQYTKYEGDDYYTVYGYVAEDGVTELDLGAFNRDGVTIGRIKTGAFKNNDSLKKITVPATVEKIDGGAFAKMTALEELKLPFVGKTAVADVYMNSTDDADATEKSVGNERLFGYIFGTEEYDGGVACEQDSVTYYLPRYLSKLTVGTANGDDYGIPMGAFAGNTLVREIKLENNVKTIGEGAFKDNVWVTTINLENILVMYDYAFKGAKNIKAAALDNLVEMGAECFAGCTRLEEVSIYIDIVADAFNGCSTLKKLTLGASVTEIGARAFKGCFESYQGLKEIEDNGGAWTVVEYDGTEHNALTLNVENLTEYSALKWTR